MANQTSAVQIIVVDDEKSIRTGMQALIQREFPNLEVRTAANGIEGYSLIQQSPKTLLALIDIRMPGMDGLALIERLRSEANEVKVVIVTGFSDFQYARQAIRLNVHDYLLKPVNRSELTKLIHKLQQQSPLQFEKVEGQKEMANSEGTRLIIDRICSWIHDHLEEELTLQRIADEYHYSANYLSTLFLKEKGQHFNKYLTECRMGRAKHLLKVPSLRMYEICQRVGYTNSKAFSIAFRKMYGMTPSEFREGTED